HKNGAFLAQAEHSSSQPNKGRYQSMFTRYTTAPFHNAPNGLYVLHTTAQGLAPHAATMKPPSTVNTICRITAITAVTSGITSTAVSHFENTVAVSVTGNDFQNRIERSRRSEYNESSR